MEQCQDQVSCCREVGHVRTLKSLLDPLTASSAPALPRQSVANLMCALEAVRLLLSCNEDQPNSKVNLPCLPC